MSQPPEFISEKNTPVGVLQSVASITGQRDRDLMALTLVNTLSQLIHSRYIAMYRVGHADQGEEAVLVAESCQTNNKVSLLPQANISIMERADFNSVFHSGKASIQPLDAETRLSIYPINGEHGVTGFLEIISNDLSEIDKHLVLGFLKVYINYLNILNESETDTLTGLLNRRTFDNSIERIIAEHSSPDNDKSESITQHPLRRGNALDFPHWLAIIDIDHFKRINDKFGHLYGDEVLLLLARTMGQIFRQHDKLFRFGGEEFVVVLDRTSEESARSVLDRLRTSIEQYHFPQVSKVTISIGFVRLDKAEASSVIIGRADQALYYAKNHGRNQVCCYDNLLIGGKLNAEHYSDDMQLF